MCDFKLLEIERKIVNLKLNLLDEYFTFNSNLFELDYVRKIHNFLFSDLYYDYQLEIRLFSKEHEDYINLMLNKIKNICICNTHDIEVLLEPSYNGNARVFLLI